jgi:capsular exopolysaccharide synthesis family protein
MTLKVISPLRSTGGAVGGNDATSDAVLMTTSPVIQEASKHLDVVARRDSTALYGITCSADSTDTFINCNATSRTPAVAAGALSALAGTFIHVNQRQQSAQFAPSLSGLFRQEQALRNEIASLRQRLAVGLSQPNPSISQQYQITALQSQISQDQGSLSQLAVQESTIQQQVIDAQSNIHIVNPASASVAAINLHPARNAILGLIIGLGVAAALIVLLEYLDDTFRSSDDVIAVVGGPVLGAVRRFEGRPERAELIAVRAPRSAIAEAYRVACTNIHFAGHEQPMKLMLVTSARDGEGKTTTSMNLAATIALSGRRVLLVDIDLRRAGLTRAFGTKLGNGLSNFLIEGQPLPPVIHDTEIANLKIVPSGPFPPNPAELLGSVRMRQWIRQMTAAYDLVILDAPPILSLADTRMLAPLADSVILVIDPSVSTRRLVHQARLALDAVGATVLGVVINNGTLQADQQHHYNYYSGDDLSMPATQNGYADVPRPDEESLHLGTSSGAPTAAK